MYLAVLPPPLHLELLCKFSCANTAAPSLPRWNRSSGCPFTALHIVEDMELTCPSDLPPPLRAAGPAQMNTHGTLPYQIGHLHTGPSLPLWSWWSCYRIWRSRSGRTC